MATPSYEGPVSRLLNRRLSRPLAAVLVHTPVTPNQLSLLSLAVAAGAGALLGVGAYIPGGLLIQLSSVADGADGDLARLKGAASRFGAVFDSVLDRYADVAVLAGMTLWATEHQPWPHPELVGFLAVAGALAVSYSRARIEAELRVAPSDWVFGIASRDVRLLAAAVGSMAGQAYWTLAVLAGASLLTVAWRLAYLGWSFGRGTDGRPTCSGSPVGQGGITADTLGRRGARGQRTGQRGRDALN